MFGDFGTAWIGKTEDFGDFVKTFANGIVFGGANNFEGIMGGHGEDLGMATRNDES